MQDELLDGIRIWLDGHGTEAARRATDNHWTGQVPPIDL
jgi:hypothetical protein